ncbi:hypothetical protein PsorP6_012155 [Peronosclerospora sorghi]|uniref:Uncharacterized protein n=1 Tax=Peronosclerospora sorghi TaxID=230839 RepID=A0ACC0WL07_9STRA|nr:hypothetical protein PsorP6_012155 [Peronosclerospora sorghi]
MDPHSMGMQGGMSLPMSMGMAGGNPQAIAMGMYGQSQQQMMRNAMGQQQLAMSSMSLNQMNPTAGSSGSSTADWRIQLTREHRANLIAKIYNEMVRVSADPVPGIKLWMNVSWYELSLYKESPTQEVYINKIFTRLKSLRAQQSDMNAAMAAQGLPNQGMLSRLDFSYYNTLNVGQRDATGGHVNTYPGHTQYSAAGPHLSSQQQLPPQLQQQGQDKSVSAANTPVKTEGSMPGNSAADYWQQHAALRAKHQGDVEKVHSAFKKYVDHMKGHDETEQKKKLRYLLSYVELCANILSEDKATHQARKIEELDKVFKYIVKIVNPYLKKLRTETDKRSYPGTDGTSGQTGQPIASSDPKVTTSLGMTTGSGSNMAQTGQNPIQSAPTQPSSMTAQQKQQHYLMQQRAQQMQQQHLQAQARQQQMMQQQQQMMRQQQMQQKNSQQQAQFSAQQANQLKQQQSQNNVNHQQTQQQLGQQGPSRPQQVSQMPVQQQKLPQPNQQAPPSRGESASMSSSLSLGLDDSLYGSMTSDLLQMPTPSAASSGGLMDFSTALSPTNFGGMDLLDWDDGTSGQGTSSGGGDSADLMTFVETLTELAGLSFLLLNVTLRDVMASSTSPPRVPSIASNLHVTASDISLFSRIDEEGASDGEGNPLPVKDEDLATRTIACEQGTEKGATLSQQLLEAIKLGTSNFLLAYNTRAGIAVLLRLFKLLQRRQWKAAMDPRQLLDEEHLSFRVDAVRLGLFLGWFTGGYKGLGALLPALLPRILPARQLQDGKKVEKISALVTGAVAALALTFVDAKRRRSFALYTLTRALQCGYNCAKRQQRWHFWGSDWEYGDALLFAISTAQIMYAYVMRPSTLPSEYFRFIHRTGPLKIETLELVQQMNLDLMLYSSGCSLEDRNTLEP